MIMYRDQLLGEKVIVRSNEKENFKVGELVRFKNTGGGLLPVVRIGEEDYMCASIVVKWHKELEDFLRTLSPAKQWEIMSDIIMSRSVLQERE